MGGQTLETLDELAAQNGLTTGESLTGRSADRFWKLTADDGLVEVFVLAEEASTSYTATLHAQPPYQRLPDPLLSWLLQRSPEATFDSFQNRFLVSLPETVLDGTGAFAGIQGRQIQRVRVSMAGEYLGRSILNLWPHPPQ